MPMALGLIIGAALGAVIGVLTDNLALSISIAAGLGLVAGSAVMGLKSMGRKPGN